MYWILVLLRLLQGPVGAAKRVGRWPTDRAPIACTAVRDWARNVGWMKVGLGLERGARPAGDLLAALSEILWCRGGGEPGPSYVRFLLPGVLYGFSLGWQRPRFEGQTDFPMGHQAANRRNHRESVLNALGFHTVLAMPAHPAG